jgi:hypothetical protein
MLTGESIRAATCSGGSPLNWTKNSNRPGVHSILSRRVGCWCVCAALLTVATVLFAAQQGGQQSPQSQQVPQTQPSAPQQANGNGPTPDPGGGQSSIAPPLAVAPAQNGAQDSEASNADRKKQIAEESAKLLKLATDLKAEVDKTTKDTLSLTVIRKADEIEKLAHSVKETMKLSAGPN